MQQHTPIATEAAAATAQKMRGVIQLKCILISNVFIVFLIRVFGAAFYVHLNECVYVSAYAN